MSLLRTAKIAALTLALSGALVGLAGFGWHCHGHRFVKERIDRHVSKVMDQLDATPDQRLKASAIEDQLLADFKGLRQSHRTAFSQVLGQFAQEQLDPKVVEGAIAAQTQGREKLQQDVRQAVLDVHAMLSPAQRQKLVQIVQERQKDWGDGDDAPAGKP